MHKKLGMVYCASYAALSFNALNHVSPFHEYIAFVLYLAQGLIAFDIYCRKGEPDPPPAEIEKVQAPTGDDEAVDS